MKRTLCLLSVLLMAVVCLTPGLSLAEEESVLISVASVSEEKGAEVDVTVLLDRCAGVDSVQFDLNFDSTALEFVSMTPGDLFAAQYTIANPDAPGRVRVACASALGLNGAGTLFTLRFRLLSDAGSALTVTSGIVTHVDADYNQSAAYVAIEDGGVAVGTAPLPAPAVTPWTPATPVPTLSPTPEPTATPEATQAAEQTQAQEPTTVPADAAQEAAAISPTILYVGGGLLLAAIVLVVILISRKKRN